MTGMFDEMSVEVGAGIRLRVRVGGSGPTVVLLASRLSDSPAPRPSPHERGGPLSVRAGTGAYSCVPRRVPGTVRGLGRSFGVRSCTPAPH